MVRSRRPAFVPLRGSFHAEEIRLSMLFRLKAEEAEFVNAWDDAGPSNEPLDLQLGSVELEAEESLVEFMGLPAEKAGGSSRRKIVEKLSDNTKQLDAWLRRMEIRVSSSQKTAEACQSPHPPRSPRSNVPRPAVRRQERSRIFATPPPISLSPKGSEVQQNSIEPSSDSSEHKIDEHRFEQLEHLRRYEAFEDNSPSAVSPQSLLREIVHECEDKKPFVNAGRPSIEVTVSDSRCTTPLFGADDELPETPSLCADGGYFNGTAADICNESNDAGIFNLVQVDSFCPDFADDSEDEFSAELRDIAAQGARRLADSQAMSPQESSRCESRKQSGRSSVQWSPDCKDFSGLTESATSRSGRLKTHEQSELMRRFSADASQDVDERGHKSLVRGSFKVLAEHRGHSRSLKSNEAPQEQHQCSPPLALGPLDNVQRALQLQRISEEGARPWLAPSRSSIRSSPSPAPSRPSSRSVCMPRQHLNFEELRQSIDPGIGSAQTSMFDGSLFESSSSSRGFRPDVMKFMKPGTRMAAQHHAHTSKRGTCVFLPASSPSFTHRRAVPVIRSKVARRSPLQKRLHDVSACIIIQRQWRLFQEALKRERSNKAAKKKEVTNGKQSGSRASRLPKPIQTEAIKSEERGTTPPSSSLSKKVTAQQENITRSIAEIAQLRAIKDDPDARFIHLVRCGDAVAVASTDIIQSVKPQVLRQALFTAARNDSIHILETLLNQLGGDCIDWVEETPIASTLLHVAAAANSLEALALLARNGANMNALDAEGRTPFQVAQDPKAEFWASSKKRRTTMAVNTSLARALRGTLQGRSSVSYDMNVFNRRRSLQSMIGLNSFELPPDDSPRTSLAMRPLSKLAYFAPKKPNILTPRTPLPTPRGPS